MRLIDADKFAIEEPKLWDWGSVDGISSTAVLKQCIWDVQCAPIVQAIPIEWIEGQIKMYDELSDIKDDRWGDIYHTFAQLLRGTIAHWRKENE